MRISTRAFPASVICIVLAAFLLVLSGPSLELAAFTEVSFEDIEQGVWGYGPVFQTSLVIRDEFQWEVLWSDIHGGGPLPPVNFTTDMIIAVAQGERCSSGFWTNITQILIAGGFYVVYVDEIHPGPNCGTLTVMTYPHHIVKVSGFPLNLPVQFIYNVTLHDCS